MLKPLLFIGFVLLVIGLAFLFFKSKKLDSFLNNLFGKKDSPDDLLNDILEVDKKAAQTEKEITESAKTLKGKLDTVKKVRQGINVR